MFARPVTRPIYMDFIDRSIILYCALLFDWDRQPDGTIACFYSITIAPAMLVILNIVIKNEYIGLLNLMEIAPPRDVVRLINDTLHGRLGKIMIELAVWKSGCTVALARPYNLFDDKQWSILHLVKYF